MSQGDLFELIDFVAVRNQVKLASSSVWKLVKSGDFPQPIGGRKRACWSRIQIIDYLFQLSRYGHWTEERTNEVLELAHAKVLNIELPDFIQNPSESSPGVEDD